VVHRLDVTRDAERAALAKAIGAEPIDALVNAAGIFGDRFMYAGAEEDQAFGKSRWEEWDRVFTINLFAAMKLCETFVENIARSELRVMATLSSTMGSIGAEDRRGGHYAYRISKTGVNMMMRAIAEDLRSRAVIAVPLHPGWVRTAMGGPAAAISPAESAAGLARVIERLTPAKSGRFWAWDGGEVEW
jgi:NAD(P)-dependent dehydrogenase (short-subunit alcohol dehydrogenase family)